MDIKTRQIGSYVAVQIVEGQTTIDLGTLNDSERDALATTLIEAAYEIGPRYSAECERWFAAMLKKSQIEIPPDAEIEGERLAGGVH